MCKVVYTCFRQVHVNCTWNIRSQRHLFFTTWGQVIFDRPHFHAHKTFVSAHLNIKWGLIICFVLLKSQYDNTTYLNLQFPRNTNLNWHTLRNIWPIMGRYSRTEKLFTCIHSFETPYIFTTTGFYNNSLHVQSKSIKCTVKWLYLSYLYLCCFKLSREW